MSDKWIPNYIRRDINYKPRDILTAQEYNAILNLLISQGDYNSSWLEYLQNDAIPEAISEIGEEEIEEVLTQAVREAIDELAASVVNKTSRQLNYPMFTLLNIGQNVSGIAALRTLLTAKYFKATYAIATNLVGTTSAYSTLGQLNTLKSEGNDIVAYSTDGATVTTSTVDTVVPAAFEYMDENDFDSDVFVYPNGNSDTDVRDTVCETFKYAVNMSSAGLIDPDGLTAHAPSSLVGNLRVVVCDTTTTLADLEEFVDDAIQYNEYLIMLINTDSVNYDAALLSDLLDYISGKSGIMYPNSIAAAMHEIHETIGNLLEELNGVYITTVNGDKYLNW